MPGYTDDDGQAPFAFLEGGASRDQPVRDMLSDPQSGYVLNRFLLKLVILSIAALAQIQAT